MRRVRGLVERVEVEDFKSYRGKQVIGPFRKFTCVIGPNGAGKSNLMDALSFVLGVRAQQLRGAQLKDLVYRGDPSHTPQRATVRLVYAEHDSVDDDDGDDGGDGDAHAAERTAGETRTRRRTAAAAGASSTPAVRLVFARSVLPSGTSEYRINDRVVSWDAYNATLLEHNIVVRARNFLVFQGDVEHVASRDARELAALLETISGSEELKERYDALKAEKQKAESDAVFNFAKKRTMAVEKKQCKEQVEEAEEFTTLVAQQGDLRRDFKLWQLQHLKQQYERSQVELEAVSGELDAKQRAQSALDETMRELRKEQAATRKSIADIENRMKKHQKDIDAKVARATRDFDKIQADKNESDQQVGTFRRDLTQLRAALAAFEQESREQESQGSLVPQAQVDRYQQLKDEFSRKTVKERQEREGLLLQKAQSDEAYTRLDTKLLDVTNQHQAKQDELERYRERVRRMQAQVNELRQQRVAKAAELAAAEAESRRVLDERQSLDQQLTETTEKLRDAKADSRQNEQARRMTEAIAQLQQLMPNAVHGRLSELCHPRQRRYNAAVSVALGRFFDAVVVDNDRTAQECVRFLREKRVGVMTFLPLDSIKSKRLNEDLRSMGDGVKLVYDVMEFSSQFAPAVLFAVGNTLVCDTLDVARRVCFGGRERHKAVTLDGAVIAKSGNMTGGSSNVEAQLRRWNERDVARLKRDREELTKKLTLLAVPRETMEKQGALRSEVVGLDRRIEHCEVDLRVSSEKVARAEDELSVLSTQKVAVTPELDAARVKCREVEDKLSAVDRALHNTEDKVFGEFSRKLGIASIRDYEATMLRAVTERAERRAKMQRAIVRLENSIEVAEQRDLATPLQRLREEIERDREAATQLQKTEQKLNGAIEDERAALRKLEQKLGELNATVEAELTKQKEVKKKQTASMDEIASLHKQMTTLETTLEQSRDRRRTIAQECRLEQIELPLVAGAKRASGASRSQSQSQSQSQGTQTLDSVDVEWDAIDFDGLDGRLRKLNREHVPLTDAFFEERLKQLEERILRMAPNLKAADRLDDVKERLRTTNEELDQARERAKAVTEEFNAVKTERFERFSKAFQFLSSIIDRVYKGLTKDADHPGGTAYLTLENSEEPYLHGVKYYAMPPQKRFRDIDQLSGGERTVAALALLFAIQEFRPAPFFVMDEVDAALDSVNVRKVVQYIRERSDASPTQFIVISLKDQFYSEADSLVGVRRLPAEQTSASITLDLMKYAPFAPAATGNDDGGAGAAAAVAH